MSITFWITYFTWRLKDRETILLLLFSLSKQKLSISSASGLYSQILVQRFEWQLVRIKEQILSRNLIWRNTNFFQLFIISSKLFFNHLKNNLKIQTGHRAQFKFWFDCDGGEGMSKRIASLFYWVSNPLTFIYSLSGNKWTSNNFFARNNVISSVLIGCCYRAEGHLGLSDSL